MEDKRIYLVIVKIGENGEAQVTYEGEFRAAECPYYKSSRIGPEGALMVPLWFDTVKAAMDFIDIAIAYGTERDFWLVQEFAYKDNARQNEAKLIFSIKSDTWPTLKEGDTEHALGVWARVRSIFICDRAAAEDYVNRFNEDAEAAFKASQKEGNV